MNEILQKRIEEAAKKYCQDKNYILPDDTELSLEALTAIDAYIEAAKSILKNQWISVEEALPVLVDKNTGKSEVVFATTDYHYNIFVAYYDYSNDTWYYNNHYGYDPQIYYKITHWMPIPQLKGGEEWLQII